jgi:uncharacterized protein (DUF2062 family)
MAHFRDRFRGIFQIKDTPHRIALAFAIGVFWGFSPLLGLHTIGAFITAWLFRLNKLATIVGVCVGNPWTLVPAYTFCLWFGTRLLGIKHMLPDIDWSNMSLMHMFNEMAYLLKPFVLGSLILSTVLCIASYFIMNFLVIRYKKVKDVS